MKQKLQAVPMKLQCVAAGALLGAAAFFLLYGFAPLNPANDAWLRGGYVEKDVIQHYTGWLLYRGSGWSWPLGLAENMNWPQGGYVGLADSIPLFAVLFKLLSPLLPATFQYFGLWGLLCSVMQGAAAALLLGLFTRHRGVNLVLCALFVFAPILLDRQLRHGALGAQWLVLLALYFYFTQRRTRCFLSVGFPVLCALAIAIHPYFVPMVLALQFALVAELAAGARKTAAVGKALAALSISFAAALLVGWAFGAFAQGATAGGTTYGYFSMNLNALLNPEGLGYFWSALLPPLGQTLGNYDGFNYLGLGLILALAVMLVDLLWHRRWRQAWTVVKRRGGLVFVGLCLTVFAVSNVITLGGRELVRLPLPLVLVRLASVLRSSGRMFYPVWYLLLLCVCVWVVRRVPAVAGQKKLPLRALAAVGLAAVQLADLSPALVQKAVEFRPYEAFYESPMQSGFWQAAQGHYRHMVSLDEAGLKEPIYPALWAADQGMTTDDTFTARYDETNRPAQAQWHYQRLQAGEYDSDTLYITSDEEKFLNLGQALEGALYCAMVDGLWYVLAPGMAGQGWPGDVPVAQYPLRILDYSDVLWDRGVLTSDPRVVAFTDTVFSHALIDGARRMRAAGREYEVLDISYRDAGWIMVTLDIEDAGVLRDVPLEFIK